MGRVMGRDGMIDLGMVDVYPPLTLFPIQSNSDKLTGEKVAIKRIDNLFEHTADAVRVLREILLLRLFQVHGGQSALDIVQIKHILLPDDPNSFKTVFIVFELLGEAGSIC